MIAPAKRTHIINGVTYLPCESTRSLLAGRRWYRPIKHETGIPYAEQYCPKFFTLEDCRQDSLRNIEYARFLDPLED